MGLQVTEPGWKQKIEHGLSLYLHGIFYKKDAGDLDLTSKMMMMMIMIMIIMDILALFPGLQKHLHGICLEIEVLVHFLMENDETFPPVMWHPWCDRDLAFYTLMTFVLGELV